MKTKNIELHSSRVNDTSFFSNKELAKKSNMNHNNGIYFVKFSLYDDSYKIVPTMQTIPGSTTIISNLK